MNAEITVPALGESIASAIVVRWLKQPGDRIARDEAIVELETDKINVEVPAPAAGILREHLVAEGTEVEIGAVIARFEPGKELPAVAPTSPHENLQETPSSSKAGTIPTAARVMPSAARVLRENDILAQTPIVGTGKNGRITKADALRQLEGTRQKLSTKPPIDARSSSRVEVKQASKASSDGVRRVPMSRLRQTIARRLKEAQNTAAILTTFNEIDMFEATNLRSTYREAFEKRHGVRFGYMSMFAKAIIQALKDTPALNAEIDGNDIVYRDYVHLGVAVSTERGLVVPVIRNADQLSFADLERQIGSFAQRARDASLGLDDLTGGTFSITNGGTFGSLLSTPILNAPQSGILGMHTIQRRPVAIGDDIVIRPMMYVALSYDHRLVDGREAVGFLTRIKALLEDPRRLLIEV